MITVIACVNAAGRPLPPHIIPKGKTAKALQSFQTMDAPEGTNWTVSDSGWTKQGIAKLWFQDTFLKNIGNERPQVLILDGHDSHKFVELIETAIENQIEIVELPAHTSNWLQPCDRTIFKPLIKDSYNSEAQEMMSSFPGVATNKANFTGLLTKAWTKAMTESNIKSCFKACGIYPFNPSAVPSDAYLPNFLYSVESLLQNTTLLAQMDSADDVIPTVLSSTTDHSYGNMLALPEVTEATASASSNPVLETDENEMLDSSQVATGDIEVGLNLSVTFEETTLSDQVPSAPLELPLVIDFEDFASQDTDPEFRTNALAIMESALEKQQLECFQYCYERGFDIDQDPMFRSWKGLKIMTSSHVMAADRYDATTNMANHCIIAEMYCATSDDIGIVTSPTHGIVESVHTMTSPALKAPIFPFNNSSFPGEGENDILQYPVVVPKTGKRTKTADKYFVLTSKEFKLKQAEEKAIRDKQKQE